ncbi:MAG: hypothetical protein M3326_06300 [Actinomycetota bacterium]|nr:hypothetical protein [Actinomycetota bacterium]
MSERPTQPPYGATLSEIITTLEGAGFGAQMASRPGGMIFCFTCRTESPAAEFELRIQRRTEGASDPADMLAVVGLVCPNCGTSGTAVLGYGPEADADDAEVLVHLGVTRR